MIDQPSGVAEAVNAIMNSPNIGAFMTSLVTAVTAVVTALWAVVRHLLALIRRVEDRAAELNAKSYRRAHERIDTLEATKLSRSEGELLLKSIERLELKQDSNSTAQSARLDAILLAITGGGFKRDSANNSTN